MHPETFLRVLGPAHWNVAYVQPARRPADGRFGENPNRLFKHYQFQVILKPAPDQVQQLYLESLEACGINPRHHDIRFEEDNWESPTLGAWGIGWQVMFDGMEISQFTYFQQAGGIELAPISAELTYGLERIAMTLQRVDSIYDIEWGAGVNYRDVRFREEVEQSKYVFGQVDLPDGRLRRVSSRSVRALLSVHAGAAALGSGLAGARALSQVLASVQHPRCQQQHRRHRANRVHPAGAAARRGHREGVCRAARYRVARRGRALGGSRTAARNRVRGAAGQLAAGADESDRRSGRRQLREHRLAPEAPAETFSTPRRLTVRVARVSPSGRPISKRWSTGRRCRPASRRMARRRRRRLASRPSKAWTCLRSSG